MTTKWDFIRDVREKGCPRCAAPLGGSRGVHHHALTVWCIDCGWVKNWEDIHNWASEHRRFE